MKLFGRVGTLLGAVVVGYFVAEAMLSVISPQAPGQLRLYGPDAHLPYKLVPSSWQLVDTGETRWDIHVGRDGARVAHVRRRADSHVKILGIGDSFAFGYGLSFDETILAKAADKARTPEIRNFAVPGYGPVQYRKMLETQIDEPGVVGVVLTTYLGNDFHDTLWDKSVVIEDGYLTRSRGVRGWLAGHSQVYRLFSNTLHRMGFGMQRPAPGIERELMSPDAWIGGALSDAEMIYRDEMRAIRDLCASRELPLLVLVLPQRSAVDAASFAAAADFGVNSAALLDAMLPVRKARRILRDLEIEYVDATTTLVNLGGSPYFRFDGHFTQDAAAAVARLLARRLEDISWRIPRGEVIAQRKRSASTR